MRNSLLGRFCLLKLDEIIGVLADLDDTTANRAPTTSGTNSPYQIVTHCLGMVRQWTRQDILGHSVSRDREAEFTAAGDVAALVEQAHEVRRRFASDLTRMDQRSPAPGRSGRDEFWGTSTEGILLHVLEELSQHLGHLEITRDVLGR